MEKIIGIDLGTTNSCVAVVEGDNAIVIPAAFGFLWLTSPAYVFLAGAAMAGVSLALAFLVPRDPEAGNESVIFRVQPAPQPAE